MTANALLLRFLPALLFAGIALLSVLLHFNGLYGQDAHEYLRQSRLFFDHWRDGAPLASSVSNAEFASGYPAVGALLRLVLAQPVLSLQIVSWIAFATAACLLERILSLLSHGSRADSRWMFVLLGLVLAPVFLRAGLTIMTDALGLALALAAFYFSLRWVEYERGMDTVAAAVFMALAVTVRVGLAGMMLPLALSVGWYILVRGKWLWGLAAVFAGMAVILPYVLMKSDVLTHPFQQSMMQHWSVANFFQRNFISANGNSHYLLPNLLYLFFPLMHPAFCLMLPGLFLLAKKTDLVLPAKRVLLLCSGAYLLLLGGLEHQNLRYLLPVYALWLLLFFPAWDRMYCYGFYFFKRLTWSVLGILLLLQLVCAAWLLAPTLARNRLENNIARDVRPFLMPATVVYGFDLDIALRSYFPDVEWRNLWEQRYDDFPPGSFVLFNALQLEQQWAGKNPMLNWTFLSTHYRLETVKALPEGWMLYRVAERQVY